MPSKYVEIKLPKKKVIETAKLILDRMDDGKAVRANNFIDRIMTHLEVPPQERDVIRTYIFGIIKDMTATEDCFYVVRKNPGGIMREKT